MKNKTIKLLSIGIILLTLSISCEEKNEDNQVSPITESSVLNDKLDEYGLLDQKEIFTNFLLNNDSTYITFTGTVNSSLTIKTYEVANKNILVEYTCTEKLDSTLTVDLGYGNSSLRTITEFIPKSFIQFSDTSVFILKGWENSSVEGYDKSIVTSDIYIISNSGCKKIESISYPRTSLFYQELSEWYKSSFVAQLVADEAVGKRTCINTKGEELFELSQNLNLDVEYFVNYTNIIVYNEYISSKNDTINDKYFCKKNIIDNSTIWRSNSILEKLDNKAIITKEMVKYDNEYLYYKFSYIEYNGTKGELEFKLNIKDGEIKYE